MKYFSHQNVEISFSRFKEPPRVSNIWDGEDCKSDTGVGQETVQAIAGSGGEVGPLGKYNWPTHCWKRKYGF